MTGVASAAPALAWGSRYAARIAVLPDGLAELNLVCSECQEVLERGPAPIPLNRQVMAAYRHEIDKHGVGLGEARKRQQ